MRKLIKMLEQLRKWWTLETFQEDLREMRRSVDEAFTDLRRSCGVISGENPKV